MSLIAIRAEQLSKQYSIGSKDNPAYGRLSEVVVGIPRNLFRATKRWVSARDHLADAEPTPTTDETKFWALKDVNFEIQQGDVVGIIGRNGAGKSTLLKILSRITEPTSGRFGIQGRVASLLEVGTGFHPELTGRENIYVSGVILGMTRAEIKTRFDRIVEFSGVEAFLDTPVKRYSSGMQVRLGFAVAAHLESEILIIDEVLAVGDAQFQKKCLGQLSAVAASGRTVIFVSHNLTAVNTLCSSAIWIESGHLLATGPTGEITARYQAQSTQPLLEQSWPDRSAAPGSAAVKLKRIAIRSDSLDGSHFGLGSSLQLEIEFWTVAAGLTLNPSVVLQTADGTPVFNTVPQLEGTLLEQPLEVGLYRCTCVIAAGLLNDTMYRVQLYMIRDQSTTEWRLDDLLCFEMSDDQPRSAWFGKWIGTVRPILPWQTVRLDQDTPTTNLENTHAE